MSRLWLAPRETLLGILGDVLPLLTPAVERSKGRYEVGDVIALCLQGHMQMWCSVRDEKIEAVCVTQILTFPRAKVLAMTFIGGKNSAHWLRFEADMAVWAKEQGCSQLEGYDARNGAWLRVTEGWSENYLAIGKPI